MIAGDDWIKGLNTNNVYFKNLGSLMIEESNVKVIKTIDLKVLDNQIDMVEQEMGKFLEICSQSFCQLSKEKLGFLKQGTRNLRRELSGVYALLGKYRHTRSLNFIGSGLKYLFGTMDNDDEEYLTMVLQNLGNRQDDLHSAMNNTVYLMSNISKQWETLKDNQKIQFNNFLAFKDVFEANLKKEEQSGKEFDYKIMEVHLDNIFISVQVQIDKLKTAILFLKAGVVDPYLLDAEEFDHVLTKEQLKYNLSKQDIDVVLANSKPVALCDLKLKLIHIVFRIPVANDLKFDLYENFIIPKNVGSEIVILDNVKKYFAVSIDKKNFFYSDILNCFIISNNQYICPNIVKFNMGVYETCLTGIFFKNNDSFCDYRKVTQKFDVHSVLSDELIMFSSTGMSVRLVCVVASEIRYLIGSFILKPPGNCSVKSNVFSFTVEKTNQEILLRNKLPEIVCCSSFFQQTKSDQRTPSIMLKSLHDIRKLDTSRIQNQLFTWKHFEEINFKDHVKEYHMTISLIIIVVIVSIVIVYKLGYLCRKNGSNMVVNFQANHNDARNVGGYPVF